MTRMKRLRVCPRYWNPWAISWHKVNQSHEDDSSEGASPDLPPHTPCYFRHNCNWERLSCEFFVFVFCVLFRWLKFFWSLIPQNCITCQQSRVRKRISVHLLRTKNNKSEWKIFQNVPFLLWSRLKITQFNFNFKKCPIIWNLQTHPLLILLWIIKKKARERFQFTLLRISLASEKNRSWTPNQHLILINLLMRPCSSLLTILKHVTTRILNTRSHRTTRVTGTDVSHRLFEMIPYLNYQIFSGISFFASNICSSMRVTKANLSTLPVAVTIRRTTKVSILNLSFVHYKFTVPTWHYPNLGDFSHHFFTMLHLISDRLSSSAIESLVEEGHIYNPVDDHHYACISWEFLNNKNVGSWPIQLQIG